MLKNKTFIDSKYIQWLYPYFQNSLFTLESYNLKIDLDSIERLALHLGVSLEDCKSYFFPVAHMTFILGISLRNYSMKTYELFEKKKWKSWEDVDYTNKKKLWEDGLERTLDLYKIVLPVMNDLYTLYIEKNHILTEKDFILLDLWFESLPVIDELLLALEESNIKYKFEDSSTPEDSIFEYGCNDIVMKEVTEENLKASGCEHWWRKPEYVNHIYKEFVRIDINLLYQWLVYKKIPNIYETKEEYVRHYITNEATGLKSLSLSTLKLLAINPLMDLDYIRLRKKQRNAYKATLSKKTPEDVFQGIVEFVNVSKK